jgi:hypothetical protein
MSKKFSSLELLADEISRSVELDGANDYNAVKAALVELGIKPANKLVWALINQLADHGLAEVDFDY